MRNNDLDSDSLYIYKEFNLGTRYLFFIKGI